MCNSPKGREKPLGSLSNRRAEVQKVDPKRSAAADVYGHKTIRTRHLWPDREFGHDAIGEGPKPAKAVDSE